MTSLIMVISVLILRQIPWLIHLQAKLKEFQMDFNLNPLGESQETPNFKNSKPLLMSLLIIQVRSGSSSSNCSHSESFDQIHQISFEFKHLEPSQFFNSNSRPDFEKSQIGKLFLIKLPTNPYFSSNF
jgi:hypothetical protein